jgi:hypothetical protein
MGELLKLWTDAGPMMYALLAAFVLALLTQGARLTLAKRCEFPGLFTGWATVIMAVALVAGAVGFLLSTGALADLGANSPPEASMTKEEMWQAGMAMRGLALKTTAIAGTPVLFALGFVFILGVLQIVADTRITGPTVVSAAARRATRVVCSCSVAALLVTGYMYVRGSLALNNAAAYLVHFTRESAPNIKFLFTVTFACGLVSAVLGLTAIVVSVVVAFRHAPDRS